VHIAEHRELSAERALIDLWHFCVIGQRDRAGQLVLLQNLTKGVPAKKFNS